MERAKFRYSIVRNEHFITDCHVTYSKLRLCIALRTLLYLSSRYLPCGITTYCVTLEHAVRFEFDAQ